MSTGKYAVHTGRKRRDVYLGVVFGGRPSCSQYTWSLNAPLAQQLGLCWRFAVISFSGVVARELELIAFVVPVSGNLPLLGHRQKNEGDEVIDLYVDMSSVKSL